jgi:hypothetical protein
MEHPWMPTPFNFKTSARYQKLSKTDSKYQHIIQYTLSRLQFFFTTVERVCAAKQDLCWRNFNLTEAFFGFKMHTWEGNPPRMGSFLRLP